MARRDVIVIGGSSGALEPLTRIVAGLPDDLEAAVFVVLHVAANSSMSYPEILSRQTSWSIHVAEDGSPIQTRRIVIARPDHHLLLEPGRISTPRGPREKGFRPAIDPLFRTAAGTYGKRVVGIVLSGGLDDGSYGLWLVRRKGGIGIVQDPSEAAVPSMPFNALRAARPEHVVTASQVPEILLRLASEPEREGATTMPDDAAKEKDVSQAGSDALLTGALPGPPSGFTCPDCGGALWENEEGEILRYRCHVGHGYNGDSLLRRSDETMETALWTALRTLEESAAMRRRMAAKARAGGLAGLAEGYEKRSHEIELQAGAIRKVLRTEDLRSNAVPSHVRPWIEPKKVRFPERKK